MTAIGLMSLIVPFLSIIASGIAVVFLIGMWATEFSRAKVSAPPTGPASPSAADLSTSAMGIGEPYRSRVAKELVGTQWISPERTAQLDGLLADHGRLIFPSPESLPSIQQVKESILEVGAREDSEQFPPSRTPSDVNFFVLKTGRIELYDDHAKFTPVDEQRALISSTALAPFTGRRGGRRGGAIPLPLPPADVQAVVSQARSLSSLPLTDAQWTALQNVLLSPDQRMVVPSADGPPAATQIWQVTVDPSGRAFFTFQHGSLVISQYGRVLSHASRMVVTPGKRLTAWPFVLAMAQLLLSMLLALYLMVTGVLTLREFPWACRMHWIYIIVKLQLCVLGVFAWMWLMGEFAVGKGPSNAHVIWSGSPWGAALAAAGAIYPLLLIILLRTRSAREYYRCRFEQG